jgi:hypothetical protein
MNNFAEQVLKDTIKDIETNDAYSRGMLAGLKIALHIVEVDKRINSKGEIKVD